VRRVIALVAFVALLGGVGLLLSYAISPPPGHNHHCSPGLPGVGQGSPYTCRYPPDQFHWSVLWTIGGLIAGLCVGLAIQALVHRDTR